MPNSTDIKCVYMAHLLDATTALHGTNPFLNTIACCIMEDCAWISGLTALPLQHFN